MLVALAATSLATGASGLRYGGDISEAIDASGAFECPCLSAFLPSMSNVKTMLEARGFPAGEICYVRTAQWKTIQSAVCFPFESKFE